MAKQILLPEFVIVTTTFSGIFLLISYVILGYTDKIVPAEMLTLATTLIAGAIAGAVKWGKLGIGEPVKQSSIDYALMGAATTIVLISFHYVLQVWIKESVPIELAPGIGILSGIILGITEFKHKNS